MIVETVDLTKRYRGVHAVDGLNLSVEEGTAFALIGANGAGKTTALKLLVNTLQPSAGRASVLGVDSRKLSHRHMARIGYVSENQAFPARLTVADYFGYLRPFYERWDLELEQRLRRELALPADRRIGALSHGTRMKMALACALPFRPSLLILDEPLSGLDPLARDEVIEGILGMAGETTILISSQELAEIENLITHVGFLDSGKLLFDESMSDVSERVRQVRVIVAEPAILPAQPPTDWINLRAAGHVLSFVDLQYSEQTLGERVRSCVPAVERIEVEALPLRSIFVALARAARARALDRETLQ